MGYINWSSQTIDHKLRAHIGISTEEYLILDYISKRYPKDKKAIPWGKTFLTQICKDLYHSPEEIAQIIRSLILKNFLAKQGLGDKILLVRDDKSIEPFYPAEDKFAEIWTLLNKNGNKKLAMKAYGMSAKKHGHDFLITRAKMYLEHLEITGYAQLHVSTFLSPTNENFLNEFKTHKSDGKKISNFFDT